MARPLSRPGLGTTTRRTLCWWLAQGETKESAAAKAGLPNSDRTHAFARTTEFATELRDAMRDHLSLNIAPRAVATLKEIMDDKAISPKVRVDAARALLDRAGYAAGEVHKDSRPDPSEMESWTEEQLRQFLVATKVEIDERDRRASGAKLVVPSAMEALLG